MKPDHIKETVTTSFSHQQPSGLVAENCSIPFLPADRQGWLTQDIWDWVRRHA